MNHPRSNNMPLPLSTAFQLVLYLVSWFLVAFGQPAWVPFAGLIASAAGFAIIWRVLLAHSSLIHRFYIATGWFFAVQLVQLSWFVSHPFWYIYAVYFFLAAALGVQFGLLALLIRPDVFGKKSVIRSLAYFLPIAALWTLFEWSRLHVLAGLSWNPIGISLTSNLYALQAATVAGVYGLSFWVILVNILALWAWVQRKLLPATAWIVALILPYAFGIGHIAYQDRQEAQTSRNLTAMLIQTAFAPEETQGHGRAGLISHVADEWGTILQASKKHRGKEINLIVLPEFVVPFGTYSDIYPLIEVQKIFYEFFGLEGLTSLPRLDHPFFSLQMTQDGPQLLVNNAYWTQGLANLFSADVLIGLEDAEDLASGIREYYSSAIYIQPQKLGENKHFEAKRYSKRVLVPLGEYIPFEACRNLAARYGVFGSFTCGKEAVVMDTNGIRFSPSICYEETYGNIIREGRQKGADLLVNLTSDVWYPNSKLPRQHLDHARLRTVENGVPLIRACNTGITAAVDSLGRDIAVLGADNPEAVEWVSDSLLVDVPIRTYETIYSKTGDFFIIGLSSFLVLAASLVTSMVYFFRR